MRKRKAGDSPLPVHAPLHQDNNDLESASGDAMLDLTCEGSLADLVPNISEIAPEMILNLRHYLNI